MDSSDCYRVIGVVGMIIGAYGLIIFIAPEIDDKNILEATFDKPLPEIWLETSYILLGSGIILGTCAFLVRRFTRRGPFVVYK